jgi:hypothetical protein
MPIYTCIFNYWVSLFLFLCVLIRQRREKRQSEGEKKDVFSGGREIALGKWFSTGYNYSAFVCVRAPPSNDISLNLIG